MEKPACSIDYLFPRVCSYMPKRGVTTAQEVVGCCSLLHFFSAAVEWIAFCMPACCILTDTLKVDLIPNEPLPSIHSFVRSLVGCIAHHWRRYGISRLLFCIFSGRMNRAQDSSFFNRNVSFHPLSELRNGKLPRCGISKIYTWRNKGKMLSARHVKRTKWVESSNARGKLIFVPVCGVTRN